MRTLIGGVGYRWQRDGSLGLLASDALAQQDLGPDVNVEDLGYGALLVAQDLAAARPPYERLVLLSSRRRGQSPGGIVRYTWHPRQRDTAEIQEVVREAGAGVVDLDHLLIVAHALGALPNDVIVIEVEPYDTGIGADPTEKGARLLPTLIDLARAEVLPRVN